MNAVRQHKVADGQLITEQELGFIGADRQVSD